LTNVAALPASVARFLEAKRIAVAGVSRAGNLPANAIYRKLKGAGRDVVPVNPNATEVEGAPCFPDLAAIPGPVDGVVVATHPAVAADLVRQAAARGISRVWFHRSFGDGSVSRSALAACVAAGIEPVVGGCPLMFVEPDVPHRCMRWLLAWRHRVPA
jgi:predicted CoA-binding protein